MGSSVMDLPVCFVMQIDDARTLTVSASGGAFAALGKMILEVDGCVWGCVWEKSSMNAVHQCVDRLFDLSELCGSKYVASALGEAYVRVREQLQTGRKVLFSGTPCQIAGLRHFLGRDYENLLCVEIFCHGVAMPDVWEEYKRQLGKRVVSVNFKDKSISWNNPQIKIDFEDGSLIKESLYENPYGVAFMSGLSLRGSCFNCQFKGGRSGADISVGDFWGVGEYHPQFDDGRGASAVVLHSEKGVAAFEKIKDNIHWEESRLEYITKRNPHYKCSATRPCGRDYFLDHLHKCQFDKIVARSIRGSFCHRVLNFVKRHIKKS